MDFDQTDRTEPCEEVAHNFRHTYCNPLSLPEYPRSRASRDRYASGWLNDDSVVDFRDAADPCVLYWQDKWYLYTSCGLAWVSENFFTWHRRRMNIEDMGYSPMVVAHRGAFYMTADASPLYRATDPLGPWEEVGPIVGMNGRPLRGHMDSMYFSDDDGRLYMYWGSGGPGILGAEMDGAAPQRAISKPHLLFSYDPSHVWERFGPYNEDPSTSFVEGAWMLKHGGRYYLTYAAPGTAVPSYAMGVYVADSPLGPYRYARRNPILSDMAGLIRGPGHGCIVRGPRDTLWAFYTCCVCYHNILEHRVGMDPAGFDEDGNLFVRGASETPQWAPGVVPHPEKGNATALLPVSIFKYARASSSSPGHVVSYAIDHDIRTWWQPADADPQPTLTVDIARNRPISVSAARILWAEPNLKLEVAGGSPVRYRIEAQGGSDQPWFTLLDRTRSDVDLMIDYETFHQANVRRVRLVITDWHRPTGVGVVDFSVFGKGQMPLPDTYGVLPEEY